LIEMQNLTKCFGDITAVDGLTLHVGEGEICGLLGPNGAGKTTTVRMLCGLISKSSGSAHVGGYEVSNVADAVPMRKLIGLVSENLGLYDDLTASQNLAFYGRLYGCSEARRKANSQRFLGMLDLWGHRDAPVATFSKGMKQKLAIARALIHDPQILFLDEPTANLDPESARTVRDFLVALKQGKRTIVLNTHNLAEAQSICDRIAILNTRLVASGTPDELERATGGRHIAIRVEDIEVAREPILAAVQGVLPTGRVRVEGDQLTVEVAEPERHIADTVSAIVHAGGRIQFAGVGGSNLEQAYLALVGRGR